MTIEEFRQKLEEFVHLPEEVRSAIGKQAETLSDEKREGLLAELASLDTQEKKALQKEEGALESLSSVVIDAERTIGHAERDRREDNVQQEDIEKAEHLFDGPIKA